MSHESNFAKVVQQEKEMTFRKKVLIVISFLDERKGQYRK